MFCNCSSAYWSCVSAFHENYIFVWREYAPDTLTHPTPSWGKTKNPPNGGFLLFSWRMGRDSNPRKGCPFNGFQDRRIRPLCHPSETNVLCDGNHYILFFPQRKCKICINFLFTIFYDIIHPRERI